MKVVYVEDYFDSDAGYQINELINVSSSTDIEQVLITSFDLSPFHKTYDEIQKQKDREYEKNFKIRIIRLDVYLKVGSRLLYKRLKRTINQENPDILFMHGFGDFKDILFLYGKNNYLTFRDCHMSWVASKNKFAKIYYKLFALFFAPLINKHKKYEKIYALGNEEREYIKALGITDDRIAMLPHGYNNNTYFISEELRNITRKDLGISNGEVLISYIGKFDFLKEPHVNFDMFEMLDPDFIEGNNLKFLFLGPKDKSYMETKFNPKLERFKYKDRVLILPGKKADELLGYYNASDICLWPKQTTLSSIHAQICGCSVIMEQHESNKERVVEQNNLFEIGNVSDACNVLARAIDEVNKNTRNVDIKLLENREYHKQIKTLLESWQQLLSDRK
jgi:glycosyltransferase involved in cell wall biosynthesis